MDFRTDRTGVLLDLLSTSADMSREHLASLTDHRVDPGEVIDYASTAREGLELLWSAVQQFADGVAVTSEADLDRIGYSQLPGGLDPHVPFCSIVWWQTRELIHHTAEAALLRDLYAAQAAGGGAR